MCRTEACTICGMSCAGACTLALLYATHVCSLAEGADVARQPEAETADATVNCADCKPRITKIKSAEGGMVLETWAQQFCQSSGYEKLHKRLGHTSNKDIQDTIKHVIGLEGLLQSTYENMRSVRFD